MANNAAKKRAQRALDTHYGIAAVIGCFSLLCLWRIKDEPSMWNIGLWSVPMVCYYFLYKEYVDKHVDGVNNSRSLDFIGLNTLIVLLSFFLGCGWYALYLLVPLYFGTELVAFFWQLKQLTQ